ncbi:MAG: tetratricopeptide repeat protein [Treponema sp.]|jgi:TolA-binding protein|nr:tetratricopeptide repeat protein [Treponema sp.]
MNFSASKKTGQFLCVLWMVLVFVLPAAAQTRTQDQISRLQNGINLYGRGLWTEAIIELRRYQTEAPDTAQRAEALYWIILSEMGAGEYAAAIRDMNELDRIASRNPRYVETPYHRGRAHYYLGRYDEALVILKAYADSLTFEAREDTARMPAALYWMGECLYSLGQLDAAQNIFMTIINDYPYSVKYEAASYRVALISQKKIEAELLSILKWTHEESLKTVEEYQRRERSYDQAIIAYQKRIADMLKENGIPSQANAGPDYRRQLEEAEAKITSLEARLREVSEQLPSGSRSTPMETAPRTGAAPGSGMSRAYSLKNSAQDMVNELLSPGDSGGLSPNGGERR